MKISFTRRAFISIEQRIGKPALLPVGHSSLSYESLYEEPELGATNKRKAVYISIKHGHHQVFQQTLIIPPIPQKPYFYKATLVALSTTTISKTLLTLFL
jgi:hypothetical protein